MFLVKLIRDDSECGRGIDQGINLHHINNEFIFWSLLRFKNSAMLIFFIYGLSLKMLNSKKRKKLNNTRQWDKKKKKKGLIINVWLS